MEKQYELRRLMASDIFPMSQILTKIGIKELKKCFSNEEITKLVKNNGKVDDKLTRNVGVMVTFDVVGIILENLPSIEKDLYKFLSNLSGLSIDEISKLSLNDFTEMLVEVVKKEEFKDFFKVVSKLFK